MNDDESLVSPHSLVIWVALFVLSVLLNSGNKREGAFLVTAYLLLFFVNHWFGALVHALPWKPFYDSANTIMGFREASYGLFGFVAGVAFTRILRLGRAHSEVPYTKQTLQVDFLEGHRIAAYYIVIGLTSWVLNYTAVVQLPSMSAVLSAGKQALIFAICVKCWLAWKTGRHLDLFLWLMLSLTFPALTTLIDGFLGYGIVMVITVCAFVGMFYRPKWRLIVGGCVALYVALSTYVGYAESRGNLRAVVWGGGELGL